MVARQAHNLKVGGSIPSSATRANGSLPFFVTNNPMKKHFLLTVLCLLVLNLSAVERVSLEQLQADWTKYNKQMVMLTTPLVVCGSFYDSLVLAPQRIFCPEERAVGLSEGDSTVYYQLAAQNKAMRVILHCRNNYYAVRTGDVLSGIQARVTSPQHLLTGKSVKTRHLPEDKLAKPAKGELRVVGANIENYFADLGGYAHRKTTPAQQERQTLKLVKALRAMNADIFAFCEMQVGDKAPRMLLEALNKGGAQYAYVSMGMSDKDRIGCAYVYNSARVRPCGEWLSAYKDTSSHYCARVAMQGFETVGSRTEPGGRRFIISLSHFKSKRVGRSGTDTNSQRVANADSLLAVIPVATERYADPDLLLLGDYNCYTQETPIQKIVRAGYKDMLPHGGANDYSYNYKGESGYLDRCFANPSMASQIVRVRPWHVNADWYYSHEASKMRDASYHRYSDHDPIIVDIRLR